MITKEQALALRYGAEVHYTGQRPCTITIGPRGGITTRITCCRVSGRCETWKTRPTEYRLPVKYGLYEHASIRTYDAALWHVAADCEPRTINKGTPS